MYKEFNAFDDLFREIDEDKALADAGFISVNRYPLRFILFENFLDFRSFINRISAEKGIQIVEIEKLLDQQSRNVLPTYSCLSNIIRNCVKQSQGLDFVISPFSELARFYSDSDFSTLIKTIRLEEANFKSQEKRLRVYIPLIGMHSRLNSFRNDKEICMWECKSSMQQRRHRLVLCKDQNYYHIHLDKSQFSCCRTVHEWVALWKQGEDVKQTIICSSLPIFYSSCNATPDPAFDYIACNNVFEFLQDGLNIIDNSIELEKEDLPYWEELAANIGKPYKFKFEDFVLNRFNVRFFKDVEFIRLWFSTKDNFSRWLLKSYYITKFDDSRYLWRALAQCDVKHKSELLVRLALLVFDGTSSKEQLEERRQLFSEGWNIREELPDEAESRLKEKLIEISETSENGHAQAMKYMTSLTKAEKQLMVDWLGKGKIPRDSIKSLFPDLYAYTEPMPQQRFETVPWLGEYFDEYRISKIANQPTPKITELLKSHNNSPASFHAWKDEFKTVRTILSSNNDIDVYYWIDGLGVDWVPFIMEIVNEHRGDGLALNELYIGTVQLPSTTAINKVTLEDLAQGRLEKIGNLDLLAHESKSYPDYICQELKLVRSIVTDALKRYSGKKIAFVSDHGISYMAQYGRGLSLAGAIGEHAGRCAEWNQPPAVQDNKYVVLSDMKMICSLTHDSLTDKTPKGQGAHGGATPEEVLVPILVVSGQNNASPYSPRLLKCKVTAGEPVVRYEILGIRANAVDIPKVYYNNEYYMLHKIDGNCFESEKLRLVTSVNDITLEIGSFSWKDTIEVNTGVSEDDIFGDF